MLYHVVRRPPSHNSSQSPDQSRNQRSGSLPPSTLMPRYHYSRILPNSTTNHSDILNTTRNQFDGQTISKLPMTTTTTSNNNLPSSISSGSFKSTIIPLMTTNRTITPNKREFVQIPITREDGTSITTNQPTRSVPITFISEANAVSSTTNNNNNNNGNLSPKPSFTNLLRPNAKYFQYHLDNSPEESTTGSNIPRLPSVSRRLSLTIPVTTTIISNTDDNLPKATSSTSSSSVRQIPIRLPESPSIGSISSTNSRTASATHRTIPVSNALQRQKTDIGDSGSSSSPTLSTITNSQPPLFEFPISSPMRRAEVMAREAIQGITRLQQQQRNGSISDNLINRSPPSSRRVIINLKNNQSVSLDSRLSSAMKPPTGLSSSSSRSMQRNNLYHIPILHEIQMPPYPPTNLSETSFSSSPPVSTSVNNNSTNYKNEFHLEIPVTVTTSSDQENEIQSTNGLINRGRILSANNPSHQTLKSILKRSSSRETVSRKNVSFMNT